MDESRILPYLPNTEFVVGLPQNKTSPLYKVATRL